MKQEVLESTNVLEVYCSRHLLLAAFEDALIFEIYDFSLKNELAQKLKEAMNSFLQKHPDMAKIEAKFIELLTNYDDEPTFIIKYNPDLVTEDMNLSLYENNGFDKLQLFPILCEYADSDVK